MVLNWWNEVGLPSLIIIKIRLIHTILNHVIIELDKVAMHKWIPCLAFYTLNKPTKFNKYINQASGLVLTRSDRSTGWDGQAILTWFAISHPPPAWFFLCQKKIPLFQMSLECSKVDAYKIRMSSQVWCLTCVMKKAEDSSQLLRLHVFK